MAGPASARGWLFAFLSVEAFMRRIDQHECLRCPHCGKGQFVSTAPIAPVPLPLLHLGDRRERPDALPIRASCTWRWPTPGVRSALWPSSRDTCCHSRLFPDFATVLLRRKCLRASHRAPSSSCQAIDSRPSALTIPITTADSTVQSNEVYPPPSPPRQNSTFVGRRINAIR